MEIREYDTVRLKDGRVAVVIDLTKPGVAYIAEMPTPDGESPYADFFIEHDDIVEVLPDDYPMPNPYIGREWWLELKLEEYMEAFDEQFPRMLFQGVANAEVVGVIEKCLEAGRPYEADLEPGVKY